MQTIHPVKHLRGTLPVPGDKSISHRALMLGALCEGPVTIENLLEAEDVGRTEAILEQLGVKLNRVGSERRFQGLGLSGFKRAAGDLYCGNSGTTLRLMTGLLAGQNFSSRLTGDRSLNRRPMGRVLEPLREMGAEIWEEKRGGGRLIRIDGRRLRGIDYPSPIASAQVKSALLLAGLYAEGPVEIHEPLPSRDHTERMLAYLGADIAWGPGWVKLQPASRLQAREIVVPGDFSSAAFFIVAALLVPGSEIRLARIGINPTRTGLLEVLCAMGGQIMRENVREVCGEPVADLVVRSGGLHGVQVLASQIPALIDEIPILAIAAARAEGETTIRGAGELRIKESDRLQGIATALSTLGVTVEEFPDGLRIIGTRTFGGGEVKSYGDHRMAMALAVAGLMAEGAVTIDDFGCIAISYPHFLADLGSLV